MTPSPCPFCTPDPGRVFHRGRTVFALWDAFPVNAGHALIIPYRHVGSWFDATPEEQEEILRTISLVRERIEASHAPAGYNIGVNVGREAGQTVDHLHVHVIPRYQGDVPDPTGGVRNVIPSRGNYLKKGGLSFPE
jgi:diadenosine tetraphosphate (Ap4A) HIT family hydrolase